jgi:hypothetical protein
MDAEAIVKEREVDSLEEWREQWLDHSPQRFQSIDLLPPWHILRAGYAIPGMPF